MVGYDKWTDHEGSAFESVTSLSTTVEWSATINGSTMKGHEGFALELVTSLSTTAEWSATINGPTMKALALSQSLL